MGQGGRQTKRAVHLSPIGDTPVQMPRRMLTTMPNADILEIYTFGHVAIQWRSQAKQLPLSPREALLLIYLAYQRRPVTRAHLCTLFWPDETPARAHGNLRKLLADARKSLDDLVISTRDEITLHPQLSYWLDAHEFQWQMQPLAQLLKAAHDQAALELPRLLYGIQLYTGEFLGQIKQPKSQLFCTWLEQAQSHLRQQMIDALKVVVASYRTNQQHSEALSYAQRLLAIDPFDEEAHQQILLLWMQMGCRNEALQHYEAYCELLKKELDTTPEAELVELYQRLRAGHGVHIHQENNAQATVVQPTSPPYRSQLPKPLTPLLGRADALQQVQAALANPAIRLVTLVGMGGIGKTHLALALAEQVALRFDEPPIFVALHDLPRRELTTQTPGERTSLQRMEESGAGEEEQQRQASHYLIHAMASALHLPPAVAATQFEQIGACLQDKRCLLIFDGFEQFGAGAAFLPKLLQAAPLLKVLVTTRESLQLPGEALIHLAGLALPSPEEAMTFINGRLQRQADQRVLSLATQEELTHCAPSLQLFLQCMQRQTPDTILQAECIKNIIQICHLVEGNPLALELAASLSAHYSWGEIADQLQHNLAILTTTQRGRPQRQRSMVTVFAEAWQLLAPQEQATLLGLSVFADTFSRTAAVTITGSAPEILMALVNKSLVHSKGTGRYELPRLLRLFINPLVQEGGYAKRRQALQAAHAHYYLDYLQQEMEQRQGLAGASVLALLRAELGNLLAACTWVHRQGSFEQRQQYVAILALLHRCAAAENALAPYVAPVTAPPVAGRRRSLVR